MLSSVLKLKKAVMCFMEKIHVLDMLCLGMGAIGCKFNVNESTIYIMLNLSKQTMEMYCSQVI